IAALLFISRPGRLFAEGALPAVLRPPKAPGRFAAFAGVLPVRPADKPWVFIVRTGMCEAAAAGAVRAMTDRFITEEGGVETRPRALAAPVKLALVGVNETRFVTCAPRSEAWVKCMEPRLIACPFTKVLREAAVTARASCAKRKLKWFALALFRMLTLLIRVLVMFTLLINVRLQRNHGLNGSPKPSGYQPIPPPKKPTNAGPKNGRAKIGPGHQPQAPPMNAQRPKWNGAKPHGAKSIQ